MNQFFNIVVIIIVIISSPPSWYRWLLPRRKPVSNSRYRLFLCFWIS